MTTLLYRARHRSTRTAHLSMTIAWECSHPVPRSAGDFPNSILDEELELLPGELTPSLVESLVRLGTWLPFRPAARMLAHFTRVGVGATTARRLTTQAGTASAAV